jgi:hypothetical protein
MQLTLAWKSGKHSLLSEIAQQINGSFPYSFLPFEADD